MSRSIPLTVQTNIVIADMSGTGHAPCRSCSQRLQAQGVLATSFGGTLVRFVTHHDVSRADVRTGD